MGALVICLSMGGLPTRSAHGNGLTGRRGTQSCLHQLNQYSLGTASICREAYLRRRMSPVQNFLRLLQKEMRHI